MIRRKIKELSYSCFRKLQKLHESPKFFPLSQTSNRIIPCKINDLFHSCFRKLETLPESPTCDIKQLLDEAEFDMKNYADRGGCYRRSQRLSWITPSEIWIILHIIRKPDSIIVLLFI